MTRWSVRNLPSSKCQACPRSDPEQWGVYPTRILGGSSAFSMTYGAHVAVKSSYYWSYAQNPSFQWLKDGEDCFCWQNLVFKGLADDVLPGFFAFCDGFGLARSKAESDLEIPAKNVFWIKLIQ